MIVKLNEVQFGRMFGVVINEAAESIDAIYEKWYSDIDRNIFDKIVSADPTYRQERSDKMGKYGKWLLGIYKKGMLKLEDLYKATEYLDYFTRYSNKITDKDIMRYKDLPTLYRTVKPFMDADNEGNTIATSKSDEIRRVKNNDVRKVYEDNDWLILIPLTWEASKLYGKNTQWCTTMKDNRYYYDYYTSQGPLYINIRKSDGHKFQFHFETDQFMDSDDEGIERPIAEDIEMSEEVVRAAYPYAADTLLSDKFISTLGGGLYLRETGYYSEGDVYRVFQDGSTKKLVHVQSVIDCVKLSDKLWWFKTNQQSDIGCFYDMDTDELSHDTTYSDLWSYKTKDGRNMVTFSARRGRKGLVAAIGQVDGNELVNIRWFPCDETWRLPFFLEKVEWVDEVSILLERYLVIFKGESCNLFGEENDVIDIFDIESDDYVAKDVVYNGMYDDIDKMRYATFINAIREDTIRAKALELYMDDNPNSDEDVDEDEFGDYIELATDMLAIKENKYKVCLENGNFEKMKTKEV